MESGPAAGTSTRPVSDRRAGGGAPARLRSVPERALRSAARRLVPEGLLPGAPGGPDPVGSPVGGVGSLIAALLVVGGLVGALIGALCSRQRLLLFPLVLGGWGGALFPEAAGGVPGAGGAALLGLAVALCALLALALRRLPGRADSRVFPGLFVVLAAAVFLGAGFLRADSPEVGAARVGSDSDAVTDSPRDFPANSAVGAVALRGPVGEDLQRIRRVLERRVWHRPDRAGRFSTRTPRPGGGAFRLEEQTVFVPPGSFAGAEAADWLFAGSVVADREEERKFAGFVVAGDLRPGPGLLTPRNGTVFLYHRLAHDREVDALLEAAGPPLVRDRFDLHRRGGRLLYVREDCRPEDLRARFYLHLEPEDEGDLPPYRRPYGFDNLDFRFRDRQIEGAVEGTVEGAEEGPVEGTDDGADRSGRCVAAVRLPDYPLRSLSTGQFRRLPDSPPVELWGVRFAPGESR